MAAMGSAADIPILIVSDNSSSERRISPSWTISQLKGRLEPVTGVPGSYQRLSFRIGSQDGQPIQAADEESTTLVSWPLQPYAEIRVGFLMFCHPSSYSRRGHLPGVGTCRYRLALFAVRRSGSPYRQCRTCCDVRYEIKTDETSRQPNR